MNGPDRSPLFLGDLDDPWVAAIAKALPSGTFCQACPGELPESIDLVSAPPRTLIFHRAHLTAGDADRLDRSLALCDIRPRVVGICGPNARYRDFERWLPLCSALIPEATARETIARHLAGYVAPKPTRAKVAVESGNDALSRTFVDAVSALGYGVEVAGLTKSAANLLIWDAPVLESTWRVELAHRAKTQRVIALIGFADRQLVSQAQQSGASACLDLPCDLDDLALVIDRLSRKRADLPHPTAPAPIGQRNGVTRLIADTVDSF